MSRQGNFLKNVMVTHQQKGRKVTFSFAPAENISFDLLVHIADLDIAWQKIEKVVFDLSGLGGKVPAFITAVIVVVMAKLRSWSVGKFSIVFGKHQAKVFQEVSSHANTAGFKNCTVKMKS